MGLVLGASLSNVPNLSSIHWRSTLAVAFSKLMLHPALGFGVLWLSHISGLLPAIVSDATLRPAFVLVAGLLTATPTANNLAVMAEVSGGSEAKLALSSMIFVMYCMAPFILTAWIAVFVIF